MYLTLSTAIGGGGLLSGATGRRCVPEILHLSKKDRFPASLPPDKPQWNPGRGWVGGVGLRIRSKWGYLHNSGVFFSPSDWGVSASLKLSHLSMFPFSPVPTLMFITCWANQRELCKTWQSASLSASLQTLTGCNPKDLPPPQRKSATSKRRVIQILSCSLSTSNMFCVHTGRNGHNYKVDTSSFTSLVYMLWYATRVDVYHWKDSDLKWGETKDKSMIHNKQKELLGCWHNKMIPKREKKAPATFKLWQKCIQSEWVTHSVAKKKMSPAPFPLMLF